MSRIPAGGGRIGKVDDALTGLPAVPLPDVAVRLAQQVAPRHAFGKERRRRGGNEWQ
jgi:hypothetical protein